MSDFQIKPATRQAVKPLIGIYAESGNGKTLSSLLLARGFVGPTGKVVLVDSESGRGSMYADAIPGGYDVLQISESFAPARCIAAIQSVERSGANIGIVDSGSHEWEGVDGVLDIAAQTEKKSGKGLHVWNAAKMEHAKFVRRLVQSSIPWIICLRAKYKTRMVKGTKEMVEAGIIKGSDIGKNIPIRDDFASPIQDEGFIFEMTCHMEILPDHSARLTKPDPTAGYDPLKILPSLPKRGEPITIQHGELLAKWCAGPGTVSQPVNQTDDLKALKSDLWKIGKLSFKKPDEFEQWLFKQSFIDPTETLSTLSADRLREVISKLQGGQTA